MGESAVEPQSAFVEPQSAFAEPQPAAFADPALELQFQQERAALSAAPSPASGLLLIGSLALFVLLQLGNDNSLAEIAVLIGVLVFHESGHWLGMRLFGYRDVKMFFIPFFGAAVAGKRVGVAAWKEAVVLMLGPLPGILLGIVVLLAAYRLALPLLGTAGLSLLLINGFNLLPLGGLDGGKLFQRLIFSRQRHLEALFLAVSGAALLALALGLHLYALGIFAWIGLVSLPARFRVARAASVLRAQRTLGVDAAQLGDEDARAVFLAARDAVPERWRAKPRQIASAMEQVTESARPPPGALASFVLAAGWAIGVALVLLASAFFAGTAQAHWKKHQDLLHRFELELPNRPIALEARATPGNPARHVLRATVGFDQRYTLERVDLPQPLAGDALEQWLRAQRDVLVRDTGAAVIGDVPVAWNGLAGREVRLSDGRRSWLGRIFAHDTRGFVLVVSAAALDSTSTRMLDSFRLLP